MSWVEQAESPGKYCWKLTRLDDTRVMNIAAVGSMSSHIYDSFTNEWKLFAKLRGVHSKPNYIAANIQTSQVIAANDHKIILINYNTNQTIVRPNKEEDPLSVGGCSLFIDNEFHLFFARPHK